MWLRVLVCGSIFSIIGCRSEPVPPAPGQKVLINAPGVNVEVQKETGQVDVTAPGVKIKVDPK